VHRSLQGQLGYADKRPLGVADSTEFQVISSCTTSVDNCPPHSPQISSSYSNNSRIAQQGKFHFPNFCGLQNDGCCHLVINLKALNKFVHFKMGDFHMVKKNKDWIAKIDKKNLVLIDPAH